jgi:hypothetical protein
VTVLATAAFAGGAFAATKDTRGGRQAFLNDVAKRLNVTPAQLSEALKAARLDQIDDAVKAGKLTQAQGDALKKAIQSGKPALRGIPRPGFPGPGGGPGFPGPGGPGGGPGFPGPGPGHAGPMRGFFGPPFLTRAAIAPVAKYLGLTGVQLRKQVLSGKSLAQIAKAQGKSTSGLEQTITAAIKARLDKAVTNKRITAAQEQKILSAISKGLGDLINRTPPKPGQLPGGGPRGFGPRAYGYHGSGGGFARPGTFVPAPPPAGPTA